MAKKLGVAMMVLLMCVLPFMKPQTLISPLTDRLSSQGFSLALTDADQQKLVLSERSPFGLVNVALDSITATQTLYIDSRILCFVTDSYEQQSEWQMGDVGKKWISGSEHSPRVAVIGLGCGITLAAMLADGRSDVHLETIEINPKMSRATKLFEDRLGFSLNDKRHKLVVDDGFRHFSSQNLGELYDVVILDVAWMQNMNATHLFSREMFVNVRSKLRPDGLFIVWSEESEPFSETSKIIYRTLWDVFPFVKAQQEEDFSMVFYATGSGNEHRLEPILKSETALLTRWLAQSASSAPSNTLDDLVMNRTKFTWFGDSKFDRLFHKYERSE